MCEESNNLAQSERKFVPAKATALCWTTAASSTLTSTQKPTVIKLGLGLIVAGHAGGLVIGRHSKVTGTVGNLTLANKAMGANLNSFPTAEKILPGVVET
jgi:hypothetical protein